MRNLRGREMSMIFQNPRAALNPIRKVGLQIEDVLRQHSQANSAALADKAVEMLDQVRIARPRERYHAYPFELSGGMCQRVVIALALACRPQLLIADEPTTGLDVTTQKTVMDLIVELTRQRGMSTILITHDLGLAATYCDRVAVMEQGHVVETASVAGDLHRALASLYPQADAGDAASRRVAARSAAGGRCRSPAEPDQSAEATRPACRARTTASDSGAAAGGREARQGISPQGTVQALCQALPARARARARNLPCRRWDQLHGRARRERRPGRRIRLRQVDHLRHGDASHRPDRGIITFDGEDIGAIPARGFARLPLRKRIQMVFQDPTDSLNPRFTAARAIADPILRLGDAERTRRRARALRGARAPGRPAGRAARPVSASALGRAEGARRHCARDRARPELVVLDEPTAALDVSVQALVLNLLQDLKESLGMSYLFVSHDLNVVRLMCDRVMVMQAGRIVEQGPTERVLFAPEAQYTRDLLAAIPHPSFEQCSDDVASERAGTANQAPDQAKAAPRRAPRKPPGKAGTSPAAAPARCARRLHRCGVGGARAAGRAGVEAGGQEQSRSRRCGWRRPLPIFRCRTRPSRRRCSWPRRA